MSHALLRRALPALLLACALPLGACDDEMDHQPRYDHYGKSSLFQDGKSLQLAPEGTRSRGWFQRRAALEERPEMSLALLERGRQRFEIYCTPCHGFSGYGDGTVPARGFPRPPSFHSERLRQARASYFVGVISQGHGVMYSYADRVMPADRWAIAAYIRALQLSQNSALSSLPAPVRQSIEHPALDGGKS